MPDIVNRMNDDLKTAMKARDEFRVGVLRMLVAKVKDAQIAQGRGEPLAEAQILQVLTSYAKQRAESAATYEQAGRADLRDKELRERDLVMEYLPAQLSDEEIRAAVREIVSATGAAGPKDLGKVMGPAMAKLKGRADGTRVQQAVKEILGG